MTMNTDPITLRRAVVADVDAIVQLEDELLKEIMVRIDQQAFHFDPSAAKMVLASFVEAGKNVVFIALEGDVIVGFVTLYESYALYAGGAFGTLAELYVRPSQRGCGVGRALVEAVRGFGAARGWTRLEVTTPPLPAFDATLAFYEREGFAVSGGRKLKKEL